MTAWRYLGVRAQLTAVVLTLALVLGLASVLQLRSALLETTGMELDKRAVFMARDVALRVADPLLTGNLLAVREILEDTMASNPDVRYAFVVDKRGALVAHTFVGGFPRDLLTKRPQGAETEWLQSEEGLLHDATAPILDGLAGQVRVGLSQGHLMASLSEVERRQVSTVVFVGFLALAIAYGFIFRFTERVRQLIDAVKAVGEGDLTSRVETGAADEFGRLAQGFNEMVRRLASAQAKVRRKEQARSKLLKKVLSAQEEERGRISRELHDEVGQALTGLIVGMGALEASGQAEQKHLRRLRNLAAQTLESVRGLSRDLRPAVLDDIGLVAALRRYTEDFAALHSIKGSLEVIGDETVRLNAAVETTLYRVVQEALTNVARHSGARHFGVVLDLRGPVIRAIVEDDGCGFDAASARSGVGLVGMAERVQLVGGQITVESSLGGGATIFVSVPLHEEEDSRADFDRR